MTTIGVLGAGQLGRMLALAGYPLGLRFRFFDPALGSPAGHLAEHVVGNYEDTEALARFADGLDLVTYEFENVPVETAHFLAERLPLYPPAKALQAAQDRLVEKTFLQNLGISTPPFRQVDTRADLDAAILQIGLPAVLKTRRMGYDGKGQFVLRTQEDVDAAWISLNGTALILEGFIPFEREVSLLAVRSRNGETAFYPLVENYHREGILRLSIAPSPHVTLELQAEAEAYASRILDGLDYVGVLAIEFFLKEGHLLANEMAPRVHNSGHWTIEGAETSQFENHLRAVLGLPLGATAVVGHAAMLNIIGEFPETSGVLAIPEAHLHLYGKSARPGRKIGHITLRAADPEVLLDSMAQLRELLP